MRLGGIVCIALAVTALLHSRRKPIEDARDERGDGDCFPHPLSSAWGLPCLRAALPERCVTAAPALYSTPFHAVLNRTGGQQDHA